MVNISEGCDDADNWRGVDSELQGTEHAALNPVWRHRTRVASFQTKLSVLYMRVENE